MVQKKIDDAIKRVAFIGNYLPRQCGIATFTTDLCEAVAGLNSKLNCFAVAINDHDSGYDYPPRVRFEIRQHQPRSYSAAADFLNINNVDVVCLQHEYGIFGGPYGNQILALIRELQVPIITTLHTILREPDEQQLSVMQEIAHRSQRLVVMSQRGQTFLKDTYDIPHEKIEFIPHGIPDLTFVDPNFYKDRYGVADKRVLLTFGLLSTSKGIDDVIRALPMIKQRYPNVTYLVVGATHPHVRQHEGESYRFSLERLAESLGVEDNVEFHNRFVNIDELTQFLGAADIYVTPYHNEEQITSGTLAYAVGAGKAVISTPYWYAQELLADHRGCLVPFKDPQAIADAVLKQFDHESQHHAMRKRAYEFGRNMTWESVALQYMECFSHAKNDRPAIAGQRFSSTVPAMVTARLPDLDTRHLFRLTDSTGILSAADCLVPNYKSGYLVADNAAALLLSVLMEDLEDQAGCDAQDLGARYLAFLTHAWDSKNSKFKNHLTYDRRGSRDNASHETHAKVLWALGTVLGRSRDDGLAYVASGLFDDCLEFLKDSTDAASWPYTLLGLHEYTRRFAGDRKTKTIGASLAHRLYNQLKLNSSPDWLWFNDHFTSSCAMWPYALMVSGSSLGEAEMVAAGLRSLRWIADLQCAESGYFVPVDTRSNTTAKRNSSSFQQHPVDVQAMVAACLEAFRTTGDESWKTEAQRAFDWFVGRNDLGVALYDSATGGCRNGLGPDRANRNQSAQSTLAFLLAIVEMHLTDGLTTESGPNNDSDSETKPLYSFRT